MIDSTPLGVGRQKYYLEQIAKDREEYLSGHGEAPGSVLGSAAAKLGLAGEVTAEQFERLFTGCDPASGELLGAAHRKDGRLGWDLVFRPVKSLSLLWVLGTPEQSRIAREAHHAAVEAAIGKLESYAVAAATASRSWPLRGCWWWASTTANRARGTRCCTPTPSS